MSKKKTHEEYVNEVTLKNPNIETIGVYINAKTPILHRCKIHNVIWMAEPSNILNGQGCKQCGIDKTRNYNIKSQCQYVEEVSMVNPNVEVIGTYAGAKIPIAHRCKIHDVVWDAQPTNILDRHGCKLCGVDKVSEALTRTHEQYVSELFLVNPNIIVLEKYQGNNISILHKCLIDGHEWNVTPGDALAGKGCVVCAGNIRKTTEQYKEELKKINPSIVVLDDYINAQTHIKHVCLIDGCIWSSKPNNILHGFGCPRCHESSGERQVRQWLERHCIDYNFQKPFDDCKDINCLPFDFYLPQYNICIEYDGEQHFEPVDFGGEGPIIALQKFKIIQRHDAIKNKYCEENNIPLLRIPYFKNIEEELNNFLTHLI